MRNYEALLTKFLPNIAENLSGLPRNERHVKIYGFDVEKSCLHISSKHSKNALSVKLITWGLYFIERKHDLPKEE